MSQEWMIDVLTDLKRFARENGLMGLAEQLDDTILIAAAELKQQDQKDPVKPGYAQQATFIPRTYAAGDKS
jgi:hypothetical protein